MIQDPTNQYIAAILSQCDLSNKAVLEIGCGKGRITRDLALHARRVVATDPDAAALEIARATVAAENVAFLEAPTGLPVCQANTFDVVIYTLSLHHVPTEDMVTSLRLAAGLLRKNGVIIVVEPGDAGSFMEAKERFGAGSGDERPAREAAIQAMEKLEGWTIGETVRFETEFFFTDEEDFLQSMMPAYETGSAVDLELKAFLDRNRTGEGIKLHAERRLNVLRPDKAL